MSEGRRLDAAAAQLKLGLSLTTHFALRTSHSCSELEHPLSSASGKVGCWC